MITLAFDTTMARCSVAIGDEDKVLGYHNETMGRGQAEALLPQIQRLCAEVGITLSHIQRLCVTTGPGSFTGVRIGVAAAKGLALALNLPVIALTTLEVVAKQAASHMACEGDFMILQDARRNQVYIQCFHCDNQGNITHLDTPDVVGLEDATQRIAHFKVAGTGTALFKVAPENLLHCDYEADARTLLQLCQNRPFLDHKALQPLYLRAPDAKLPQRSPITALRHKLG